jgi:carotenoid 1,2-hydratase
VSDDRRHALTLIAFIGSVFSPYYAAARRNGGADPRDHVAVNVALYGDGARRWTMTERRARTLERSPTMLRIGPSALHWEDGALVVDLDEVALPWPRRVRGRIRLAPQQMPLPIQVLDPASRHCWQPIAPRARVSVDLQAPDLYWSGDGYLDANWGLEPLEKAFSAWEWSRTTLPDGGSVLRYDTRWRDGRAQSLNLHAHPDGRLERSTGTAVAPLASSRWGIARSAQAGSRLLQTLEDGPFYARSMLETPWRGGTASTIHESLSLDRFASRWVQALLPFRMPRRIF